MSGLVLGVSSCYGELVWANGAADLGLAEACHGEGRLCLTGLTGAHGFRRFWARAWVQTRT